MIPAKAISHPTAFDIEVGARDCIRLRASRSQPYLAEPGPDIVAPKTECGEAIQKPDYFILNKDPRRSGSYQVNGLGKSAVLQMEKFALPSLRGSERTSCERADQPKQWNKKYFDKGKTEVSQGFLYKPFTDQRKLSRQKYLNAVEAGFTDHK